MTKGLNMNILLSAGSLTSNIVKHILLICTLFFTGSAIGQLSLKAQQLKTISDFASEICNDIPLEGQGKDVELSGNASAKLRGLLGKLADLGVGGTGKLKTSQYQGVLRKDLASVIQSGRDCKLEVFKELKNELLSGKSVKSETKGSEIPETSSLYNGTYLGVNVEGLVRTQVKTVISRQGNRVSGSYYTEGMVGVVEGFIENNVLYYDWKLGNMFGKGITVERNGQAEGTWGYGASRNNGGTGYSQKQY